MKKICLLLCLAAGVLSACGGVKDKLGLAKQSPDEFMVMSRAPLSLPPDYNDRPVPSIEQAQKVSNPFDNRFSNLTDGERKFLNAIYAEKTGKK